MVKIYFCGSISGGRQLGCIYAKLISMIQVHGKVLTEHVGDDEIRSQDGVLSDREIHDRDLQWIVESDMLIADVTVPSLGVGCELGRAIEMGKPILCLFNTRAQHRLSAMIAGCQDLEIHHYNDPEDLIEILARFISRNDPRRTA